MMDRITIYLLAAATALAILTALIAVNQTIDVSRRLAAIEYTIFGKETYP